jgi:hypothetical protein
MSEEGHQRPLDECPRNFGLSLNSRHIAASRRTVETGQSRHFATAVRPFDRLLGKRRPSANDVPRLRGIRSLDVHQSQRLAVKRVLNQLVGAARDLNTAAAAMRLHAARQVNRLAPQIMPQVNLPQAFIATFYILNIGAVISIAFGLLYYFVDRRNFFQQRAEMLLLNILPKEISEALKATPRTIADEYIAASIRFADVVEFTPMAAAMTAVSTRRSAQRSGLIDKTSYQLERVLW